MEQSRRHLQVLTLLLLIAVSVQGDFLEPLQPVLSLRSQTEAQTRLPCHYKPEDEVKVVQVTWNKELPDGTKDPIVTAHFSDGHRAFGRYSGRLNFENNNAIENSALLIRGTEESDEGSYSCHISTFPSGNFERHIKLTVWNLPISSLDPVSLVEGQPYGVVATCRAAGRPVPQLSWDTDLPGKVENRTGSGGSVSSFFSLYPLRSMNGKKLDCLVWHPGFEEPRRISNRMLVQYPPDATISSPSGHWYVGLEKAELVCKAEGQPKPEITWRRRGGPLPDGVSGVSVIGEKLAFDRALHMNDSGVYECLVKNAVGSYSTEYTVAISEQPYRDKGTGVTPPDNRLVIIIGAAAGVAVLVLVVAVLLVRRHHRKKTKALQEKLQEKTEEMISLSRQASFRRLNSVSSDPRILDDEYSLRMNRGTRNSQMSLGHVGYRDSQSIQGGRWGPVEEVARDDLGRPVVWNDDQESIRSTEMDGEKEEHRKWVESFVKNSNMSLDSGLPSSLVPLKAQQEDCIGPREPDLSLLQEADSPPGDVWIPSPYVEEGCEDDGSSSSFQIAESLSKNFYYKNGFLRPKQHSNGILLHSNPQII